ncbi:MAG: SDR family oxidoreductase [Chloroflexi bacterium]|nr:SDR family oxidoreductase [Chloroflexota bacterium]
MAEQTWRFDTMMRLDGKVAINAGAGGLGQALAWGLSEAGAAVVVADVNMTAAEEVAEKIRAAGRQATAVQVDVTVPAACEKVVALAVERLGRVDVLLNGVGINQRCPSLEMSEELWDRINDINLKGAFFFAKAAAARMVRQGTPGKIITITSHMGLVGLEERVPYCASKGGIVNMTRALGQEWAKYRINVNALAPTFTPTAISAKALSNLELRQTIVDRIPFHRLGEPEDLVGAVVYMAAPASDFMTGQTMVVDGGWLTW